jgi:ribosome-binding protein aMBF1 (putative translation factor)
MSRPERAEPAQPQSSSQPPSATSWEEVRQDRLVAPAARSGYQRTKRAAELGEQIRALREAGGISQAELARRIGSTQPSIARLEAGRVSPTLATLERVAAALGAELIVALDAAHQHRHAPFVG